ncbi:uncharacterized protein LOC130669392 isoform X2 [Microplitis mediator]|uniref:uncharacterized protein LOC130669392 isoform X2 n=1 Tax=Microplitis mediator TaxID=375433 RepID=UPI002555CE65|nr:uncharacterized protein LOC130669392 isoform X2 [Microplitis mediator]
MMARKINQFKSHVLLTVKTIGTYERFCTNCQEKTQICEQVLNAYIYIELDIKLSNDDEGMECRLRDFPTFLTIEQNEAMKLCYRLCGAIGFHSFHYIAYCRRLSGEWRFYNDSLKESKAINSYSKILPHGVLYLLNN